VTDDQTGVGHVTRRALLEGALAAGGAVAAGVKIGDLVAGASQASAKVPPGALLVSVEGLGRLFL